jgi:hypothetical protein
LSNCCLSFCMYSHWFIPARMFWVRCPITMMFWVRCPITIQWTTHPRHRRWVGLRKSSLQLMLAVRSEF